MKKYFLPFIVFASSIALFFIVIPQEDPVFAQATLNQGCTKAGLAANTSNGGCVANLFCDTSADQSAACRNPTGFNGATCQGTCQNRLVDSGSCSTGRNTEISNPCAANAFCEATPGATCSMSACPGTCKPKPVAEGECIRRVGAPPDGGCAPNFTCEKADTACTDEFNRPCAGRCVPKPVENGECTRSVGAPEGGGCAANFTCEKEDAACTDEFNRPCAGSCVPKPVDGGECRPGPANPTGGCAANHTCDTSADQSDACRRMPFGACVGTCKVKPTSGSCTVTTPAGDPNGGCADGHFCNKKQDTCVDGLGTRTCQGECVANGTPTNSPLPPPPPPPPCKEWSDGPGKGYCKTFATGFGDLGTRTDEFIQSLFAILLSLSGGIALLLILKAGYQMMTSQGKPEQLQAGRDQLVAAIVGLVFLIFSFVILQIIGYDILRIPGFMGIDPGSP